MKKYSTVWDHQYWMKANGMYCGLNTPDALKSKGEGEDESYQGLPPYAKRASYLVDKYPACPNNWLESAGTLSSYFVPVEEGKGMWLDFNKNNSNSHEVAIVVSIQGVNPLTGLPCEDQQLEQYIESCPKCKTAFKPERLCEACGFKYPKQNYICTTGTPNGQLWLDGFRAINGAVRQYLISAEKMRGVASNVLGNDRVFAIGVSFFLSKSKKERPQQFSSRIMAGYSTPLTKLYTGEMKCSSGFFSSSSSSSSGSSSSASSSSKALGGMGGETMDCCSVNVGASASSGTKGGGGTKMSSRNRLGNKKRGGQSRSRAINTSHVQTKSLEVAAGANIKQLVYDDPEQLDFWRETPEATICINYCLEEDATKIIEAGEVSLEGNPEGFLQSVPVGN